MEKKYINSWIKTLNTLKAIIENKIVFSNNMLDKLDIHMQKEKKITLTHTSHLVQK